MKKSDKVKTQFIEQLAKMPIIQAACEKQNVARATFYRWKQDDPKFAEAVEEALHEGASLVNDVAESQLISAVKNENLRAVMYWLQHHHGKYKNKVEIGGTLQTIQELTPEQQELVTRALKLAGISNLDNQIIE